jgi:hypothetical protein
MTKPPVREAAKVLTRTVRIFCKYQINSYWRSHVLRHTSLPCCEENKIDILKEKFRLMELDGRAIGVRSPAGAKDFFL